MSFQNYQNLLDEACVNINGELISARDAKISIFDRGFLYGDSIYEVTYSENFQLLFLEEHLQRLEKSAKLIDLKLYINKDWLKNEIMRTLKYSQIKDAYIRIIVTRGETEMTLDPNASFHNNVVIIVKNKPVYDKKFFLEGLSLAIVSVLRNDPLATEPNAKSGNYLNNVMAMAEAKKRGAQDAIMINKEGHLTEGTTFNLYMVKDGSVFTPPSQSGLLEGITRQKVLELCEAHQIPLRLENFSPLDIANAQEVFITSSTRGIMPIRKINDIIYGENINDWPLTKKIQQLYTNLVACHKTRTEYFYGPR